MKIFFVKILFVILIFSLCSYSQVSFENVATQMGITFSRESDFYGGGLSFLDFDSDGWDDITFTDGIGSNLMVFQNQISSFSNVTAQLGINDSSNVQAALWADYDNDGDKDLFLSCKGDADKLFNYNANGYLINVTLFSGISIETSQSTAAAWADYNNDGQLDLYIGVRNDYKPNILYKNNGDGTFSDVTIQAGVADTMVGSTPYKLPLALSFLDYNNDGWQDLYIANDKLYGNTLFKNNGDNTFTDVSEFSGTGIYFDAMGIAIGDYNGDGFFDLYVSNSPAGNALLKNNGNGTFTNLASELGIEVNKICWGVNFLDFNNDSHLDLFVSALAGGLGLNDPERQNALFKNEGDGTFTQLFAPGINTDTSMSYGNAIGDFNNDGYDDIAVVNAYPTMSALWKNSSFSNNWIKIQLEGTASNRDGIGSLIEIYYEGKKLVRSTHCGLSYLSQNSSVNTIGVGSATSIDSIKIIWPSRITDTYYQVAVNQTLYALEGETITDIEEFTDGPKYYYLEQNYPNPFNPVTTINFSLASDAKVTIRVFDILGQQLIDLIKGQLPAGVHKVDFDASNLNSGVYFYQLEAKGVDGNDFKAVKKMILTK